MGVSLSASLARGREGVYVASHRLQHRDATGGEVDVLTHTARSLAAGDSEPDSEKQSYRRKLHSFYEVKEEIGRYSPRAGAEPLPRLPGSPPPAPPPEPRRPGTPPHSSSPPPDTPPTPCARPSWPPPRRGVFGFVKRAQHKGSQMSCAAKFIPLRSRTRTQAYRERDILATLSHPLVTGLLDQFETRKTLILVLELYPALSLREGRQGPRALRGLLFWGPWTQHRPRSSRGQGPGIRAVSTELCPQGPGRVFTGPLPCFTGLHQLGGCPQRPCGEGPRLPT